MPRASTVRVEFTRKHDNYLVKYLAKYCPTKEGRCGLKVFKHLSTNEGGLWPWHVHHTWQSWRERYVKNQGVFDAMILSYQEKHDIEPVNVAGRKRNAESTPIDVLRPNLKRVKLQAGTPSSETCAEQSATAQHTSPCPSRSKSTSKLVSEKPSRPQGSPGQANPPHEPEHTNTPPSTPPRTSANTDLEATEKACLDLPTRQTRHDVIEIPSSSPEDAQPSSPPNTRLNTNPDATKNPSLDLPTLQTRDDTLEIPSSSPKRAPPPTDDKPEPRTPSHAAKRTKEGRRTPSDLFASETSSSGRNDIVHPRAPPRVVNSLYGQVLVDQKGHVPHAVLHEPGNRAEEGEEGEEDKGRWPPLRGPIARQREANERDAGADVHHAFSQSQPPVRPEVLQEITAMNEREREKSHHPFEQASETFDGMPLDRRTVAARFLGRVRRTVASETKSEQREDTIRNGASPVKRTAPTAPPPDSHSDPFPKPFPKVFKYPAPRASTRSPFRPDPPAGDTLHPPPQPQPRTGLARDPALARIRRQTIGHGNEDGHRRKRRCEHNQVPSIDLVAMSRSSTSARSHSRSSTGASAPARPPRWSLPASAYATSWMLNETEGKQSAPASLLGSGSGSSFRWIAPSPVYGEIWGRRHMRAGSPIGTSTPRFTFTPSPARSMTIVATNTHPSAPRSDAIPPTTPLLSIAPHPSDVPLTASHGLASILAHMSANHGLALGVVEAVYGRVGSLREADEVLRGMREAAEGFGEREIERRVKRQREERRGSGRGKERRQTELRYVVAPEDGEGSEYSPPETSRAALWIRQSELAKSAEESQGRAGSRDDEEEEEEEEEGRKAQELERQMGRGRYRRDIVRRFI